MKVRLRKDQKCTGESTLFDKGTADSLLVNTTPDQDTPDIMSIPMDEIEVFLERAGHGKWMAFKQAIKNHQLVICGAPYIHFREP